MLNITVTSNFPLNFYHMSRIYLAFLFIFLGLYMKDTDVVPTQEKILIVNRSGLNIFSSIVKKCTACFHLHEVLCLFHSETNPPLDFAIFFFIYFFMGGRVDYKEFGLNFGWNKDLKDNSKENRFVSPLFLRTERTLFGIEEELFHVTLVWSQLDLMQRKQKRSPQLGSLWLL